MIYSDLKRLRKEANKQVDTKTLYDEFRAECNRVKSVGQSGVYSVTGDAIFDYFKTAKKGAEKKGRSPSFIKLMELDITRSGFVVQAQSLMGFL